MIFIPTLDISIDTGFTMLGPLGVAETASIQSKRPG